MSDFDSKKKRNKLEKIIIISNHKIKEIEDLKNLFKEKKIYYDHFGEDRKSVYGGYRRVDEKVLNNYDLCITNAKSVHYFPS